MASFYGLYKKYNTRAGPIPDQVNTSIPNPTQPPEPSSQKHKKHRRFIKRRRWRKIQDRKKAKAINTTAIYNYSDLTLTKAMTKQFTFIA